MRKFYNHSTYVHVPLAVTDVYTVTPTNPGIGLAPDLPFFA